MTAFAENTKTGIGGFDLRHFLAGLTRRAHAAMAEFRAKARARRQIALMRGYDDHVLRDIGVTRAELDAADRAL